MPRGLALGVLVSGEGTTLEALADEIAAGGLGADIVLVVSDRATARAIPRAKSRGIPTAVLERRGVSADAWGEELHRLLTESGVELVVLAGFLSILPDSWLRRWRGRAINVHPALLPAHGGPGMYGRHVHEAVLRAHELESGATVHLVTEQVDGGPVLGQARIPIRPGETPESLRERIRPVERGVLFDVIGQFAEGKLPLPYPERGERRGAPRPEVPGPSPPA